MAAGIGNLLKRAFTGPAAKETLKSILPGAGLSLAMGTLTGGPAEGLAYAAGDIALNYPALRLARKLAPGTQQQIKNLATGKTTIGYSPSVLENITNLGASVGSSFLVGSLLQPKEQQAQQFLAQQAQQVNPALQAQPAQISQQNFQRELINEMVSNQLLAPGTMYQLQGAQSHYPGVTLPPDLLALIQEGGMPV
jgi:hypothetical protein